MSLDTRSALEWWRGLTPEEKQKIWKESSKAYWTFNMFSASTSTIARAYNERILQQNRNF